MRTIRLLENGQFTCLPKSIEARRLCTSCGKKDGCVAAKDEGKFITSCDEFMHTIAFRSQKGLDTPAFNTLRLGKAWSTRVRPNDRVRLADGEDQTIGWATVTAVILGTKEEIIRAHAKDNHLLIESEMTREEAGDWMLKQMPNLYGNLIYKNNELCTVIQLSR